MKRKRFVKLLMSKGFDRNEANRIAVKTNMPYKVQIDKEFAIFRLCGGLRNAAKAFAKFTRNIEKATCTLKEATSAFKSLQIEGDEYELEI